MISPIYTRLLKENAWLRQQIDELSTEALLRYIPKSEQSSFDNTVKQVRWHDKNQSGVIPSKGDHWRKIRNRRVGRNRAMMRIANNERNKAFDAAEQILKRHHESMAQKSIQHSIDAFLQGRRTESGT